MATYPQPFSPPTSITLKLIFKKNHHLRQIKGDVLNVVDVPKSPTRTHHVLLDGLPELVPGLPLMSQNQNDLPPVDGVPEKSALCFREICSCNRPPVSAQ